MNAHENLVRNVVAVGIAHAKPAKGVPHVAVVAFKDLAKRSGKVQGSRLERRRIGRSVHSGLVSPARPHFAFVQKVTTTPAFSDPATGLVRQTSAVPRSTG